jgi:hypothetical protein
MTNALSTWTYPPGEYLKVAYCAQQLAEAMTEALGKMSLGAPLYNDPPTREVIVSMLSEWIKPEYIVDVKQDADGTIHIGYIDPPRYVINIPLDQ